MAGALTLAALIVALYLALPLMSGAAYRSGGFGRRRRGR